MIDGRIVCLFNTVLMLDGGIVVVFSNIAIDGGIVCSFSSLC